MVGARHLLLALGALVAAGTGLSAGACAQAIAHQPVQAGNTAWPVERAQQLLEFISGVAAEGLDPVDYRPDELRGAIAAGNGPRLDAVAGTIFGWLAADLRDGHTPLADRRAYLMEDPDVALLPTPVLMERALAGGDVAAVLASLKPAHPDYAALRRELANTPVEDTPRRNLIRANMDRWRWLPRDLGTTNVMVNVPEFMVRLTINGQTANSYRAIVGRPGRSATPQLSEMVEGIILNPTWTVPQSIVVGEGLGSRVLGNPAWARTMGYVASRSGGMTTVVQQPGPRNALGLMKLDMPNEHAIFLHDTPNRSLFAQASRALSHGCVRVERAMEFAMTLSLLGGGAGIEESMAYSRSGEYTRVPLQRQIPVYLAYFTLGLNDAGELTEFGDIYNRDGPVLASLARPDARQL